MSRMRFLHLAAADHGGAGIAARRMHEALRMSGHESRMLVLDRRTSDPDVRTPGARLGWFERRRWIKKAWLKLASRPDHYFQDQGLSTAQSADELLQAAGIKPDVILVHFISHFLSSDDVRNLAAASGAPVLWSLLDMATLTGGCHYAWDCKGYQARCGNCPALRMAGPRDASAAIWETKQRAIAQTPGWVLAGSSLLKDQARSSSLLGDRRIETLLLGVNPEEFGPHRAAGFRSEQAIEPGARVIFFGAQRFDQRRKGMSLLKAALDRLAQIWPQGEALPVLLSAGNATDFSDLSARGYRLVELGHVDTATLSRCYAASNVFACPSIEDSGPMMINESMMSGTPVVAFRMGVAPDLVIDGQTGFVVPLGDAQALAQGLLQVLLWNEEKSKQVRVDCRNLALALCRPETQLQRLVEISKQMRLHFQEQK